VRFWVAGRESTPYPSAGSRCYASESGSSAPLPDSRSCLSTSQRAVLWGPDYLEYGHIEVRPLGVTTAIAISPGLTKKKYDHTDPNEDVVAALEGERAVLLVCADGHNGLESSEAAIRSVLDQLGEDPPPADLSDEQLVELFHEANEAVLRKTQDPSCPNSESRTTLTVALVAESRLQWGTMGDAALMVSSTQATQTLGRKRSRFVGWPDADIDGELDRGELRLQPSSWVVLATDGFADFAPFPNPEAAVEAALERGVGPAGTARLLVELAFEGGGGDNIAVAVAGPTP
jgi:serine/threonine protein phosphatase PrpC